MIVRQHVDSDDQQTQPKEQTVTGDYTINAERPVAASQLVSNSIDDNRQQRHTLDGMNMFTSFFLGGGSLGFGRPAFGPGRGRRFASGGPAAGSSAGRFCPSPVDEPFSADADEADGCGAAEVCKDATRAAAANADVGSTPFIGCEVDVRELAAAIWPGVIRSDGGGAGFALDLFGALV